MYAIFESGGKQHRAEPGQRLALEKLTAPVGETVVFDRVLLVRDPDSGDCRIGAPYVEGAEVTASVVAQYRDPKVVVFKRKRRKGYRRKRGHRQQRTQVRVDAIRSDSESAAVAAPPVTEEPPTEEPSAERAVAEEAVAEEAGAEDAVAAGAEEGAPAEPESAGESPEGSGSESEESAVAKTGPAGGTGED